jgi:hypothetical protein
MLEVYAIQEHRMHTTCAGRSDQSVPSKSYPPHTKIDLQVISCVRALILSTQHMASCLEVRSVVGVAWERTPKVSGLT